MLQTAHTAVAAALSLIYWVQLMRALNTSFSTAVCRASFYTNETNAKTPHIFVTGGFRTAWELTELLWLFTRGRRVRKREMKGEKEFCAKWASSWCHLHGCLPQQERASEQRPRACATELGSASFFLLTHPRPQVWPLHLRERSSRGRRESWPSWQGNSSLAAGSGVRSERFPLPECYGMRHSQPNVQFQFLISLQNRRSWFIYLFIYFDQTVLIQSVCLILLNKRIPGSQQAPEYLAKASKSSYILHSAHPLDKKTKTHTHKNKISTSETVILSGFPSQIIPG